MSNNDELSLNEIIPGLYLGNYDAARNIEILQTLQITHILIVGKELEALYPEKFFYFKVDAQDNPNYDLSEYFDQMADFINKALKSQGKILVHCAQGISRSSSAIIAYLLKYTEMSYSKAFKFVEKQRPIIHPNGGFRQQLNRYEKSLLQKFKSDLKLEKFTRQKQEQFNKTYEKKKIERRLIYYTCFKCKSCKKELFSEKDISHQFSELNNIPCTFMFINNKKKLNDDEIQIKKPIFCSNPQVFQLQNNIIKCKIQIGEYNLKGYKCTCGKKLDESVIKIYKPKIYPEKKTKELFELILKQ